ncbi:MAG: hypothetical protein MJ228_03025 [Bacilli bacterium]|nr:hypothetical protein [Bacilli bacterium]
MRSRDSKEYYNAKEGNHYEEYKSFKAEEYYPLEIAKSPLEISSVPEIQIEETNKITTNNEKGIDSLDQIKNIRSTGEVETSVSSSSSVTATSASSGAAQAAATTAGGTVASAAVTAVAVVVSGVAGPLLDTPVDPIATLNSFYSARLENSFEIGSDYAIIKIEKSDMQMEGDSPNDAYELVINIDDNTKKVINIDNVNDEYLVTGLKPETTYKYSIGYSKYENNEYSSFVTRYTNEFVSIAPKGEPTLLIDKANTHVTLDENNHLASLEYSCFLSEYNGDPVLAISRTEGVKDFEDPAISSFDEAFSSDHFFNGTINSLTSKAVYFTAFGVTEEEGLKYLDSKEYKTDIPEDYSSYHPIIIDEAYCVNADARSVTAYGEVKEINKLFTPNEVYAKAVQYDEDGQELSEVDAAFELSEDSKGYEFFTFVSYGISKVKFVLVTSDGNTLYESPKYTYDGDQSYPIVFDKVAAKDVEIISYDSDNETMDIKINTGFDNSYFPNFLYRVEALDLEGSRLGTYEGSDAEVILTIPQDKEFRLRYTEVGTFVGGDHEYETYYSSDTSLGKEPILILEKTPEFDGCNWVIPYICDSIYDYEDMSIELSVTTSFRTYEIVIEEVEASGIITLDIDEPELGEVEISGLLLYKDNQNGSQTKEEAIETMTYDLSWKLDIVQTTADITNNGVIPVTLNLDYLCPESWTMQFYDGHSIEEVDLTNEFTVYLSGYYDSTITVEFLNDDGNIQKTTSVDITPNDAVDTLQNMTFGFDQVNPGDSVVTYNSDGTMNIYRDMRVSGDTANFFYDAMLVSGSEFDEEHYIERYEGAIHNISNERYSVIEDVPMEPYYGFVYYKVYLYDNVHYLIDKGIPSGGIEHNGNMMWTTEGRYDGTNNTSEIEVIMNYWCELDNWYELNGIEYQFDSFQTSHEDCYLIVTPGYLEGATLKLRSARYSEHYDELSLWITMKGDRFFEETYVIEGLETV